LTSRSGRTRRRGEEKLNVGGGGRRKRSTARLSRRADPKKSIKKKKSSLILLGGKGKKAQEEVGKRQKGSEPFLRGKTTEGKRKNAGGKSSLRNKRNQVRYYKKGENITFYNHISPVKRGGEGDQKTTGRKGGEGEMEEQEGLRRVSFSILFDGLEEKRKRGSDYSLRGGKEGKGESWLSSTFHLSL